jgi:aquaporin Z
VALAFGLSLLAMVYAIGPISGCHLNPAVTLALVLTRKFPLTQVPGYVAAQLAGAIVASAILLYIASGTGHFDPVTTGFATNGYGARSPGHYSMSAAFVVETIMTALLVLVILGATDIKAPVGFAGLAIGLALTLIHLVSIPVTNTSVNPARSIGPALFAGTAAIQQLWLFILAPVLGATIASGLYSLIRALEPAVQIPASQAQAALLVEQAAKLDLATAGTTLTKL